MSADGEVVPFLGNARRGTEQKVDGEKSLLDTIANLTASFESLDQGLKLMIDALTQQDKRIRALELALRKAERKNVPVLVNQHGEKVI
jgi:hypothetical protein